MNSYGKYLKKFCFPTNLLINRIQEPIRIGYPGTKFLTKSTSLINISPDMPNLLDDYETYYQLVIMDGAELRKKAAETWSECKKID